MNPIGDREMSAPTQKKARTSGGQPASLPEILLYEGGKVAQELLRSLTHVRVGPQVTEIPDGAFSDCVQLVELQLNEGLKVIGSQAFEGCISLRNITIPSSVIKWGWKAFAGCSDLIKLQLNEGLEVIGEGAFYGCTVLRSVTLPSTVTELGNRAFIYCSGLTELQLNEGLQVIDVNAFAYCEALQSVTIPSTVTELGGGPFYNCRSLTEAILLNGKRLINQEFFSRGFQRGGQGLLNQEAVDKMLLEEYYDDEENDIEREFTFLGCPLNTVKISISWAVSERMARLPRECRLSIEERIHTLNLLELQQDGSVFVCFPVVSGASDDETHNVTIEVRDTNNETARSLYRVLQLIAFHELKESSILIELALRKSKIDGATSAPRADCRVAVPDPAKSLIMEYSGFVGFLQPVIEGA